MAQKNKRTVLTAIKKLKKRKVRFRRKCENNYRSPLRVQLVRYLQSMLQSSTTHGLPYIVNNRFHYLEKTFWIVNIVVCIIIMIILLTLQYVRFVSAPTVMSVERNYFSWNISYPAITLCPLYKPDTTRFGKFVNDTNNKTGLNMESYLWAIAHAALDTLNYLELNPPSEVQLIDPKNYAKLAATMFREFQKGWLASNTNRTVSVDATMTEMGMCHVINSNVAIFDKPQVGLHPGYGHKILPFNPEKGPGNRSPGIKKNFMTDVLKSKADLDKILHKYRWLRYILETDNKGYFLSRNWNGVITADTYVKKNMELSIFDADFITMISDYAPIYKVFIHGPDEVTMTTGSSFTFDVEGLVSFGLSVWSTRISEELRYKSLRLRKCRFINEPISKRYPVYSFNHCILECRIKMILKLCGCVPHFYKPLSNERICNIPELKCVLKHRKEIITLKTSEDTFKQFCNTKDLPKISRDCGCLNSCELDMYYKDNEDFLPQKELKRLKIKITSFPKVRVVRDVIFSFYDIVLRSGGVMNLCIGSSFISLVELLLVIVKCFLYFAFKAVRSIY